MSADSAELALAALARDLLEEIAAGRAIELAAGMTGQDVTGAAMPRQGDGRFAPAAPGPGPGWHHTLRNSANRSHLLGADPFAAQLYGRAAGPGRAAALAAHGPHDGGPGGSPAAVLPDSEMDRMGMYEAARGMPAVPQAQPPAPQPARQQRRRGRHLRYQGRR